MHLDPGKESSNASEAGARSLKPLVFQVDVSPVLGFEAEGARGFEAN